MSEITVKGKIARNSKMAEYAVIKLSTGTMSIDNPPADWQEGQEVLITIRTVTP